MSPFPFVLRSTVPAPGGAAAGPHRHRADLPQRDGRPGRWEARGGSALAALVALRMIAGTDTLVA